MFIHGTSWIGDTAEDTEQHLFGDFFIMANRPGVADDEIRCAIIKGVHMEQCGHFMMASLPVVEGRMLTLSGAYGGDGLPVILHGHDVLWEYMCTLPADLREAWNEGCGWNSAGNESTAMRAFANEHYELLEIVGICKLAHLEYGDVYALPESSHCNVTVEQDTANDSRVVIVKHLHSVEGLTDVEEIMEVYQQFRHKIGGV